jgi:tetratricopeptide (TPR) repeat protein
MAAKVMVNLWHQAIKAFDSKNLELTLEKLQAIEHPTAYLCYNIGVVQQLKDGASEDALKYFKIAIEQNKHFCLGYFSIGCLYFRRKQYNEAIEYFEKCESGFLHNSVDYAPLGLSCRLHLCEVIYNAALCYGLNGNMTRSIELLLKAKAKKQMKTHDVIDRVLEALNKSSDFSQFQLLTPAGDAVFRPMKLQNDEKFGSFLGSGTVLVSQNPDDNYVGFRGLQNRSLDVPDKRDASLTALKQDASLTSSQSNIPVLRNKNIPSPPASPPPRRNSLPIVIGQRQTTYPQNSSMVESPPSEPPPRSTLSRQKNN